MEKEKLEWVESTITEKSDILPESQLKFNEDGSVTIPEVTLSNQSEALKYIRSLEKGTLSKLRESNEYVINEVKKILEGALSWIIYEKKITDYENSRYYQDQKETYVEKPLKFLSKYKGNLSQFMDIIAETLKTAYYPAADCIWMRDRFWVSKEELSSMDTISIIKKIEKDINTFQEHGYNNPYRGSLGRSWAGEYYLLIIEEALKKLWYDKSINYDITTE